MKNNKDVCITMSAILPEYLEQPVENKKSPYITICTPTYNRASLIRRLYDSLVKQDCKDFEWLVVDDGSSDDTDKVMEQIKEQADFVIRYNKQPHGGKHRAVNRGVSLAKGYFFFIVDSDDYLPSYSIQKVREWAEQVEHCKEIVAVSGLRQYPDGTIVGECPKRLGGGQKHIDVKNTDRYFYKLMGDKAEVYKTEFLRKNPFPEFENEFFITESVCWNRLAKKGYKIRWYGCPIYICEYQTAGLTNSGANGFAGHRDNYCGYCYQVKNSLAQCRCYEAVTFFREYHNTSVKMGKKLKEMAQAIGLTEISYCFYLLVKLPFFYGIRMLVKIVRIIW